MSGNDFKHSVSFELAEQELSGAKSMPARRLEACAARGLGGRHVIEHERSLEMP